MRRIPLGALQEREFRLFFTGQLVSLIGDTGYKLHAGRSRNDLR